MEYASKELSAWRLGAAALVLALVSAGCAETSSEELGTKQDAILDGVNVGPSAYPAVGFVRAANGTTTSTDTGTGTLIGPRYVITAAHVVQKQWGVYPPDVSVSFDTGGGKVKYPVESIYIHPSYLQIMKDPTLTKLWERHSKEGVFDVALLILSQTPVGVTPVALSTAVPTASTAVSFLGYGMTATGGAVPVPNNIKYSLYRGTNALTFVDQTYALTQYKVGTSGTYSGDSGGPLMIDNAIAGVTNSVTGYNYDSVDTFTRLGTIQPWISGMMGGPGGMFAPDVYESTEQTRPAFALNSINHYSEPRSFTNAADLDQISFQLDRNSHVRISCPHHFDWTTPFVTASVTKNGAAVTLDNPNVSLYEGDLGPGTYVVTVKNNYSRGLSYTLGISADGWFVQGDAFEPDGARANQLALGNVSDHNIMPANDEDYMFFDLSETSNVRIETLPVSGTAENDHSSDTVVTLMDASGNFLEFNDDKPGASSYCSFIERRLDPGSYLLKVGGYAGNQVSYYGMRVTKF